MNEPLRQASSAAVQKAVSTLEGPGESLIPQCREVRFCPVCDGANSAFAFSSPDYLHGIPGTYSYRACSGCDSVYQSPAVMPEDLPLCYPPAYFTHDPLAGVEPPTFPSPDSLRGTLRRAICHYADGTPEESLSGFAKLAGRTLSLLQAFRLRARYGLLDVLGTSGHPRERCLEVGPGRGTTLRLLSMIGWQAVGLDLDPAAAETARRNSGCEVRAGTIVDSDFPASHFDMIYMSHVVEHLPDFQESLRRCFEMLKPRGRLVLIYPNPNCLTARYWGRYSCIWDPPRHLVLPSRRAIMEVLKRTGFAAIESKTLARMALTYRVVTRQYQQGTLGVGFVENRVRLNDRLFGMWESLLVALGRPVGEEILVIARKK